MIKTKEVTVLLTQVKSVLSDDIENYLRGD